MARSRREHHRTLGNCFTSPADPDCAYESIWKSRRSIVTVTGVPALVTGPAVSVLLDRNRGSDCEHLHDFVAIVIDDLDRDLSGLRLVERP